jgi:hypothetical protein
MSFPTTLPKQAVAELLSLALSPDKPDKATLALSVYDLAGFVLKEVFGNVAYPVGGLNLSQIESIINLPVFQNLGQVVTDFESELAAGKSRVQALASLTLKYGPTIAETVLEILALTKG